GTSVVVSGLAPVATYEFRAMTLGADGAESEYGSVLSATTKQAQLPTPTLTLVGATESTIVVGWSAISGAKSYTLQYRVVGATSWTNKGAKATDSSGEIAGLTSGAKYEVRLRANGDGGATYLSSNFSAVLTATAEPKLFTPTLTATATDATIVASWTAISGAKSYTLQYKASDATAWTNQGVKATETSYVFTNLAPGVAYDFRLRANGDGGVTVKSSEFSAVVSAKIVLALASPTLSVVETGNDAATLAWSAVDDAAAYRVEYRIAGSDAWTSRAFGSDATSATISGLTSGKTYEFRVCAVGDGVVYVDSEFSAVATAAIGVVGPVKLATPTLTVSSTDAAMIASWTASPGATSYALYYRVSGETAWTQQRGITADMTSYAFATLAPGSTYDFQIRANGDGGVQYLSSDYSVVLGQTFVAPLPTPVLRVTQLSASSTNRSITLSWDAIANAKSYTLQYKLSSASSWTNVGVRATETSYTLSGLAAGTYDFRLRANGDGGATCKSSEFSAVRTMPLGDALDVPFDPADELDDDLLTALAENWK
ncbi:MAG: fibronectin type III domain-containing protein, partial [Thermoguttaceae bacterium]|nr:fibronectin type III domain-containing protein [Thermoguttaceae bacterium]